MTSNSNSMAKRQNDYDAATAATRMETLSMPEAAVGHTSSLLVWKQGRRPCSQQL